MRRCLLVLAALLTVPAAAQDPEALPFSLELVEVDVTGMPGLHSFAWAEHGGRWLFITGRVDGLHGIIESGAFAAEQANGSLWVVDLAGDQVWSRSLSELGDAVADPLKVSNPQYHQEGETLYVVGGYGTDSSTGDKITFPTLTALDVPGLIGAVVNGGALAPHIRQSADERLAVTGGELRTLEGRYLLLGGHRFDGAYSPGGGSFTQAYTNQIASFLLIDQGGTLGIDDVQTVTDEDALHRRDLTVAPSFVRGQCDGAPCITQAHTMYAGVFQPSNLPYRTQIHATLSDGLAFQESSFEQRFSHYTAPALPLWDEVTETMHTAFFGGMAQFYFDEDAGEVVEDRFIPFTDDIVTLTHEVAEGGTTYETVMPVQMPGLLGTNAALIPASVPRSDLEIVRLRDLDERTLMGYIVGGILSTMPNPGWMGMTAAETSASDRIFAVYLTPEFTSSTEPAAEYASLRLEAPYPNPFRTRATVALVLDRPAPVVVEVFDVLGRRVAGLHDGPLAAGRHTFALQERDLAPGVYVVHASGDGVSATRSVVRVR
ncbi:MAG: T9SS type A sorting domain-containing protein [Bacteroidota bacterium]